MTRGLRQSILGEPGPRADPGGRVGPVRGSSTAGLAQEAWPTSRSIPPMVRRSLLFLVATMPFEQIVLPVLPGSLNPVKISFLFLLGCCFWYPKTCFHRPAPAVLWFSGYLAVFLVLGMFIPEELRGQLPGRLLTMALNVFIFWVGSSLLQDIRLARQALFTFGAATAGLAVGIFLHLPGFAATAKEEAHSGHLKGRMIGADVGANYLAALMALAAIMLIGLLLDNTARTRARAWLLACLTAPLLLLLIKTGSRGGLVSFVLGASLFLIPLAPSRRRFAGFALGGFGLIALGVMVARDPLAVDRLNQMITKGEVAGRDVIYPRAIQMVLERPILGWGPFVFLYELGARVGLPTRDPHNTLLWLLLEGGIVGTFFFVAGFWRCFRGAWRSRAGPEGILPLALIMASVVKNFTGTGLAQKMLWMTLAIALASPVVSARWKRAVSAGDFRARGKL